MLFASVFISFLVSGIAFGANDRQEAKNYRALFSKTETHGTIKIIVRVDLPFTPERMLPEKDASAQRAGINGIQDQLLESLSKHNIRSIKRFRYIPYMAFEVDSKALTALFSSPLVVSVEEDVPLPLLLNESVPLINADDAWNQGYTGSGWTVAILDTGVDKTHSFFNGNKVVSEACFSTTYAPYSSTTLCPNALESQTGSGAGVNCDSLISSGCGHGTHVAGIAAGNSATVKGVAKDAGIIAVQVFSRFDDAAICDWSPPCILSYISDQMEALEHVYSLRTTYNIAAVNMSLGGGEYSSYCDTASQKAAIDNLRSAGIATVIASGNDGYCNAISSPACISTAVSVGATTKSDAETYYNNYHPTLMTLFAPGSSIYSSVPGGWGYKSGTSMAAPHVTGAWAVLKQKLPSASVSEILNTFVTTGVQVTSPCDNNQKPRIDVLAALNQLSQLCTTSLVKLDAQEFNLIQTAYNNASNSSVIQARAESFSEDLIFNGNIDFTLRGGYDCNYNSNTGYTTVNGSITISSGTLVIENVIIK